jgi:hypothetical protein
MPFNDRNRMPASGQYASDIQLLPVNNSNPGQQRIPRKPLITVGSSSYEPYQAEVIGRETCQSRDDVRVPRSWPTVPQRLSNKGPFYFIVAVANLLVTLSPLMFIGECRFGRHVLSFKC